MDASAATDPPAARQRPLWQRLLWGLTGGASLATGIVGIFLPLLPTTPFVLFAAFCFSRSSSRCERWLLQHKTFGPLIADWRAHRAIPLRAKQLAWSTMAIALVWVALVLPLRWAWLPFTCCAVVALWMWRLPSAPRRADQPE